MHANRCELGLKLEASYTSRSKHTAVPMTTKPEEDGNEAWTRYGRESLPSRLALIGNRTVGG